MATEKSAGQKNGPLPAHCKPKKLLENVAEKYIFAACTLPPQNNFAKWTVFLWKRRPFSF